ncbi:MAG: NADH-quinone oxidoreductase subunit N [Chloroflexi bacterium]|nr:NADH-quinone oxidoreductase subunit N [Chloroflexota bacterium]
MISAELANNLLAVAPEILLTLVALVVILADLYLPAENKRITGYIAGLGLFGIAIATLILVPANQSLVLDNTLDTVEEQLLWGGMIRSDDLARIFRVMVIFTGGLTCLMGMGDRRLNYKAEFYAIIVIATIGASLLSAAADLVMIFIALETVSISLYILSGFIRLPVTPGQEAEQFAMRSAESGLKYFLFGSFTSAFFLYGLTLIYGFSGGHTNIYEIGQAFGAAGTEGFENVVTDTIPLLFALLMVTVGFGFKISAVPFHFWTPDVYEGAPTPVTSYISTVSKAASFAVLVRFMLAVFSPEELLDVATSSYSEWWVQLFAILSVVTMTLGNLLALVQRNIKRLIAYSSIAQAGYTLMGVAAIATTQAGDGAASVAFYMFMYVFTNTLLFAVVILFTNATNSETIADMAGLSRRSPWLALAMTLALLSLAGIPPAAGFVGKFLLFRAAVDSGLTWLAMIGVLNAIVALYYYLVVVKVMYVDRSEDDDVPINIPNPYPLVIGTSAAAVVLLGTFLITPLNSWAEAAGLDLFRLIS